MQTIAFLSQKGGSGKSTTAAALAVAARQRGLSVMLLDTDHDQATLSNWGKRRGETDEFVARGILEANLAEAHERAKAGGADLIIIDTQGSKNTAAIKAAKLADLVLIPCPPNRIDMETLEMSKSMADLGGPNKPAYVVFTKVAYHDLVKLPDAETVANRKYGLECAPVHIGLRKAYGEGLAANLSPQEIERDGKVAAEINALLEFVYPSTRKQVNRKRA